MNKMQQTIKQQAAALVAQMTVEEKAALCSGQDCWNLKAIERLGLAPIAMMDGPHGLRKQIGSTDNLGIGESVPAVCFPTASALACSFDPALAQQVGQAIGEECVQEDVAVVLGPGANMKRSPLCGRNFEYFSEDPLLSGLLAAGMIRGIQSTGTGASLKHFAVNNQEKRRMTVNAVIDERTLHETYLRAFEIAVKQGKPDTVMCAYNRLNGAYCSENETLLTDILRRRWGFGGLVVSDWGAVHDRAAGVAAGLDLEMPGNHGYNDAKVLAAAQNGSLPMQALDDTAQRVTELILKGMQSRAAKRPCDLTAHHQLAVHATEQSAVLLKNDGGLLPAAPARSAAVIGAFAKNPRYQAAGSSKVNPFRVETAWDAFVEQGAAVTYAPGYALRQNVPQTEEENLLREACAAAQGKEMVYLFVGLPDGYETEGVDRTTMALPPQQNRLLEQICGVNPNVVVVLVGGAPVELPWAALPKAILLCYLGGEGAGRAVVNLLFGHSVPCGKLAETWPLQLADTPANCAFPGGRRTVEYRESIYVGYRYYEKAQKPVRFAFGHGLSYTQFAYSDLRLGQSSCRVGDALTLSFNITNTGGVRAKETALVFAAHESETVFLPPKQLCAFTKIELAPGECKRVELQLDTAELGYYNTLLHDWYVPGGSYTVLVGPSSANCPLAAAVQLNGPAQPEPDLRAAAPVYYDLPKGPFVVPDQQFAALYGAPLPVHDAPAQRPYTPENTLEDVAHTLIGRLLIRYGDSTMSKAVQAEEEQAEMMAATVREMPLFAMVSSEELTQAQMERILELLNGHPLRAIKKLL